MAIRATRCVPHHHHAVGEVAETDHPALAVVLAKVLDLEARACEDERRILEVQPAGGAGELPLGRGVGEQRVNALDASTGLAKQRAHPTAMPPLWGCRRRHALHREGNLDPSAKCAGLRTCVAAEAVPSRVSRRQFCVCAMDLRVKNSKPWIPIC